MKPWPAFSLAFTCALTFVAVAWASLAAGVDLGADCATLFYTGVLALAASCKIATLRPWRAWPKLSWPRALGLSAALLGGCLTAWLSPALYKAAALSTACSIIFSAGLSLGSAWPSPRVTAPSQPDKRQTNFLYVGLLCAAAFYPLVIALRTWVQVGFTNPRFTVYLFYLSRNMSSNYEGNPGGAFHWSANLAWPILWWIAVLSCAAWAYRTPNLKKIGLLALVGLAGKFSLACLSADGLRILPDKIRSVSTSYYQLTYSVNHLGPWNYIQSFNAFQKLLGPHGVSHPFGPELFYWALIRIGGGPWTAALTVMALTALTPVLLYLLALELDADPRAGLAAGLLYLASPAACILSTSGIDCLVSLVFLACGLAATRAVTRKSALWGFLAGLLLFAASLLTVAAAYLGLMLALSAIAYWLNRPKSGGVLVRALALTFLTALALHAALWAATLGNFNYLRVARAAAPFGFFYGARPAYLWSWLNPLLFLGYAGAGTLALAVCSGLDWLLENRCPPLAALIPLCVLVQTWLQGLAFGECQRVFHWGYIALSLLALSSPLWGRDRKNGFSILALLATLNALASLGLMMTVMDYW